MTLHQSAVGLLLLMSVAAGDPAQAAASRDAHVGNACAELNRRVVEQTATGQLREAEATLAEAMANGTNRLDPACGGLLLNNLAAIMLLSGRFAEAEAFAERSVSTLESVLGPNATGLLRPLRILAGARLEQGKIGKAHEALTKMRRIPLERAENRALVHGAAAALFQAEGRFTESESEFRSAVMEWERAGKSSSAEVASLLSGLASLYLRAERLDNAAPVLDRALAALAAAPDAVAMDRIRLLQLRATLYRRKGNWRQAEEDLEQAIALAGAEPRSDAEMLVSMMTDYAQLLRNHHQRREARSVEQQTAALRGHSAMDNTVDVTELRRKSKSHGERGQQKMPRMRNLSEITARSAETPIAPRERSNYRLPLRCRRMQPVVPNPERCQLPIIRANSPTFRNRTPQPLQVRVIGQNPDNSVRSPADLSYFQSVMSTVR